MENELKQTLKNQKHTLEVVHDFINETMEIYITCEEPQRIFSQVISIISFHLSAFKIHRSTISMVGGNIYFKGILK